MGLGVIKALEYDEIGDREGVITLRSENRVKFSVIQEGGFNELYLAKSREKIHKEKNGEE